jgi:hypothetical protein
MPGDLSSHVDRDVKTELSIDLHVYRPRGWREAGPMKLLIIDDEPHIRHMMRLTLEDTENLCVSVSPWLIYPCELMPAL